MDYNDKTGEASSRIIKNFLSEIEIFTKPRILVKKLNSQKAKY